MNDTLQHFGVKGMKWGQRNRVAHLTNRYMSKGYDQNTAYAKAVRRSNVERKLKKAALIGGGVALAGLAAYAGYKGANYLMAKRKMDAINSGLDTMNQIRESNMLPKKGKIREASRKLKDKTRDIRVNNTNKIKEASKKITDRVKETHRKDTERFTSRMKEAMEAEAARKSQKEIKKAASFNNKKSLGQKLKEISTNFKNINKKSKKQTTAIDMANSDALKLFKELSNK